jgi:hypothetical protein
VGYLEDGNMVVVENGREELGRTVRIVVTGIHQTRAGTLIFGTRRDLAPGPEVGRPESLSATSDPPPTAVVDGDPVSHVSQVARVDVTRPPDPDPRHMPASESVGPGPLGGR